MADEDFLSPDFGELVTPKAGPRVLNPFEILTPFSQKDQADFRPHISKVVEPDEEDYAPKSSSVPEFAPSSAPPLPPETDESQATPVAAEKVSTANPENPGDLPF